MTGTEEVQTGAARSTVSEIVEVVRADLQSGKLVAGQAVRERDLAARFGVSRTPAREAITRLIAEGILTQGDSARGATVVRPTAAELQKLYEIRLQLEPLAAELAAKNADDAALLAIAAAVDDLDYHTGPAFFRHHIDFHLAVSAAAQRPLLHQIIENLRYRSDPYVRIYLGVNREEAQRDHRQILEALMRRDGLAVAEITRSHLRRTIEAVRPFVDAEMSRLE